MTKTRILLILINIGHKILFSWFWILLLALYACDYISSRCTPNSTDCRVFYACSRWHASMQATNVAVTIDRSIKVSASNNWKAIYIKTIGQYDWILFFCSRGTHCFTHMATILIRVTYKANQLSSVFLLSYAGITQREEGRHFSKNLRQARADLDLWTLSCGS